MSEGVGWEALFSTKKRLVFFLWLVKRKKERKRRMYVNRTALINELLRKANEERAIRMNKENARKRGKRPRRLIYRM